MGAEAVPAQKPRSVNAAPPSDVTESPNVAVPLVNAVAVGALRLGFTMPELTVNGALLPAARVSPPEAVAVKTTPLSATLYVTPLIVIELLPLLMVPVKVPPTVPVPVVRVRVTSVVVLTLMGVPPEFCACTSTLNGVLMIGFDPPFTEVMTSLFEAP